MLTTVAIKQETFTLLKDEKQRLHAQSYDEVIHKLILSMKKPKRSYFGAFPEIAEGFERDKSDRFN